MTTTSSLETWTSARRESVYTLERATRAGKGQGTVPLSMPSAPSRMAASKLASVFSGYAADACEQRRVSDASRECWAKGKTTHAAVAPAVCASGTKHGQNRFGRTAKVPAHLARLWVSRWTSLCVGDGDERIKYGWEAGGGTERPAGRGVNGGRWCEGTFTSTGSLKPGHDNGSGSCPTKIGDRRFSLRSRDAWMPGSWAVPAWVGWREQRAERKRERGVQARSLIQKQNLVRGAANPATLSSHSFRNSWIYGIQTTT